MEQTVIRMDRVRMLIPFWIFMGGIPLLAIGLLFTSLFLTVMGVVCLSSGGLFFIYYKVYYSLYKLILTRNNITEVDRRKTRSQNFDDLIKVGSEIIVGPRSAAVILVFTLIVNNTPCLFKTSYLVNITDVLKWVKINFPNAQISKSLSNFSQ